MMPSPSQVQATLTSTSKQCCSCRPSPIVFLLLTLLMTSSATAMLCAAIMTDHWEHVTWDTAALNNLANVSGQTLQWILDGRVARLPIEGQPKRGGIFLVPMNGGIWTLCIDLDDHDLRQLGRWGFPRATKCINYLAGNNTELDPETRLEEPRAIWQHSEFQTPLHPHLRMQNLSISCSLVCLIILGSAALVGAFGICQRQVSAVLVTGVMYLLAALFALFALMIIHFKRQQGRQLLESDFDGTIDGLVAAKGSASVAQNLLGARIFHTAWSLDLGWGGVALTSLTSFLWISLSKIMRLNPLSSMI